MRIFKSKIDKLSKKRQTLIAKRDNAERAMRERNSKREAKSQALLNRGTEDWEETNRFKEKINRELDKLARDIDSEKIYVEEVARTETKEYLADKKEREEFKKFDKAFLDSKPEETPNIIKKKLEER